MTKENIAVQLLMASDWESVKVEIRTLLNGYVRVDFTEDWELKVADWCLNVLGLDGKDMTLITLWYGDDYSRAYGFDRARRDMQYVRNFMNIAELMERRDKIRRAFLYNMSY